MGSLKGWCFQRLPRVSTVAYFRKQSKTKLITALLSDRAYYQEEVTGLCCRCGPFTWGCEVKRYLIECTQTSGVRASYAFLNLLL